MNCMCMNGFIEAGQCFEVRLFRKSTEANFRLKTLWHTGFDFEILVKTCDEIF